MDLETLVMLRKNLTRVEYKYIKEQDQIMMNILSKNESTIHAGLDKAIQEYLKEHTEIFLTAIENLMSTINAEELSIIHYEELTDAANQRILNTIKNLHGYELKN